MAQSLYLNNGGTLTVSDVYFYTMDTGQYNTCVTLKPGEETITWLDAAAYINGNWTPHYEINQYYGLIRQLVGIDTVANHAAIIEQLNVNGAWIWGNVYSGGLYIYRSTASAYGLALFAGHGVVADDPSRDIFYLANYTNFEYVSLETLKAIAICHNADSDAYAILFGNFFTEGVPYSYIIYGTPQYENPLDDTQITRVLYNTVGTSTLPLSSTLNTSDYYSVNPLIGDTVLRSKTAWLANNHDISGIDTGEYIDSTGGFSYVGYSEDSSYIQSGSWWGGDSNIVGTDPNYGPTNTTGGGYGTPSSQSDDVGLPDDGQFNIDVTSTGFVTIYNPTAANMTAFNRWLFASFTDAWWDNLKKILQDPLDFIIGAGIIKYKPTVKTALQEIKFNGIGTEIFADTVKQWEKVDCGSVKVNEQFQSYLDYNGFSDVKIFLPFCGIQSLDINDVMGSTIHVIYYIDNMTGSCVAHVNVNRLERTQRADDSHINSVLYKFSGNVMQQLPLTNKDYASMISAVTQLATSAVAAASTGGAATLGLANQAAGALDHLKPTIQRSGNLGSNYGMMDYLKPYLILERPIRSIPAEYGGFVGYPSASTVRLGACKGFTKGRPATNWATNIHATDQEKQEIKDLIEGGIYI